MTIRSATTDDIKGIRRVAQASWRNDYPEILSRETVEEAVEEWYDSERIKTEIKSTDALVPIVEMESNVEIIGFAQAVWDANTGTILRLYVSPDHRGQGVGTDLLEWTVDALADQNVQQIQTLVLSENTLGNEFYQDFGFEKTGENQTVIGGETYSENTYTMHV
jgi:ribosomal protein S18 acetylase RimI-like enzyme